MKKLKTALAAAAATGALLAPAAVAPAAFAGIAEEDAAAAAAQEGQPAEANGPQAEISDLEAEPWIENSKWYPKYKDDARVQFKQATSPAMNGRKVPLAVIPAKSENRPTVYLLNGAGSGEQDTDWLTHSSVVDFYSDKDVNVVIPMAGAFSYYIDWLEDPTGEGQYLSGPQKWETFLTKELPGPLESAYNANGKRAIAGMSMSATSSLLLAEHNPDFYDATGSFAGCAATSRQLEYNAAGIVVGVDRGVVKGPDLENVRRMWGPQGSPTNVHQDALVNADKLQGTPTYISSSSGVLSEKDLGGYLAHEYGVSELSGSYNAVAVNGLQGMPIEGAVNKCTHDLKAKMDSIGVPATYNFRDVGVHNWNGWEDDLIKSWEVFGPALEA